MKKLLACVLVISVVALSFAASAFAAPGARRYSLSGCRRVNLGVACLYVDADGDGVCDNRAASAGGAFVDADGDSVCDNRAASAGGAFVDADGDGVCDNSPTGGVCQGGGAGRQNGRRGGRGR